MRTKYQIILIGSNNIYSKNIIETLKKRMSELGIDEKALLVIKPNNFSIEYKANAPAFCLYFGDEDSNYKDIGFLNILIKDATLILPIASDITKFSSQIPNSLRNINGFELATQNDIEKLSSVVLEGFSLLRLSRRVFISYKRDESTSVAIQLYEQLEKNGFDVFLDTHSIRPGEPFQEELWHRMADTDVIVLLNTPNFLKSYWTTQELAEANSMSIGILQLIWPSHKIERNAQLSVPVQLKKSDFIKNIIDSTGTLATPTLDIIVNQTESLRARSLASRQDNIITEFMNFSHKIGVSAHLQPEKFITLSTSNNDEVIILPTVGVPQAFTYNQSDELISRIKSKNIKSLYILYDHRNIRKKWLMHIDWLDNYLPIKSIKITEIEKWLKKI